MNITLMEACASYHTGIAALEVMEGFGIHPATGVDMAILRLNRIADKERQKMKALEDYDADTFLFCLLQSRNLTFVTKGARP